MGRQSSKSLYEAVKELLENGIKINIEKYIDEHYDEQPIKDMLLYLKYTYIKNATEPKVLEDHIKKYIRQKLMVEEWKKI